MAKRTRPRDKFEPTKGTMARTRLLSAELDTLRDSAWERTRSIDTKASFVVVSAGVVAAATSTGLISADTWFLGAIPLGLTLATIIVAAAALWPVAIKHPTGQALVDRWLDTCESLDALEIYLLKMKASEIRLRNDANQRRGKLTKWAFKLLIAAVATTLVVAILNAISMEGEPNDDTEGTVSARALGG